MQVGVIGVDRMGKAMVRNLLKAGHGRRESVPLPFASVLRDNFLDAIAHRDANKDWVTIAKVAARRAGLQD